MNAIGRAREVVPGSHMLAIQAAAAFFLGLFHEVTPLWSPTHYVSSVHVCSCMHACLPFVRSAAAPANQKAALQGAGFLDHMAAADPEDEDFELNLLQGTDLSRLSQV